MKEFLKLPNNIYRQFRSPDILSNALSMHLRETGSAKPSSGPFSENKKNKDKKIVNS